MVSCRYCNGAASSDANTKEGPCGRIWACHARKTAISKLARREPRANTEIARSSRPCCRLDGEPMRQHGCGLQKVVDLHGFTRIVAAVGVAHEQHGGWHPCDGKGGGVVGGRTCKRHGGDAERGGRACQ